MNTLERTNSLLERVLTPARVGHFAARAGLPALPLAAPSTAAEAAEVLRLAASERWTILPLGLASKLGWARPPERADLVLTSSNLRGVVAYEPGDGTLTARAGTPWSELVAVTRGQHHVSPELPDAEHATLGGTIASGASGFDRLRHGPLRHQILGLTALHPDGALVKSGGRVVKNVTGYDLHRLWCGSQGTLCFLVEATLRLYPAPAAEAVLRARTATRAEGLTCAHALVRTDLQPVAVVLQERDSAWELAVVLAGREEVVQQGIDTARGVLGAHELDRGDDARRTRAACVALDGARDDWPPLSFSCRPSQLAGALERLDRLTSELGLAARIVCHPLLASVAAWFPAPLALPELAALDQGLTQAELAPRWRDVAPEFLRSRPPPAASPALALMQRLKQSIDPAGVFARGRFHDSL